MKTAENNKQGIRQRFTLNKKAIVDNFLTLLFVIIGLVIIFMVLFFFISAKAAKNKATTASDLNIKEGLYTTRVLLNQELSTDYKVYDAVIEAVNNGDYETLGKKLDYAIQKYYPEGTVLDKWLIIVNDECFVITNVGVTDSIESIQHGSQFGQGAGMSQDITIDNCEESVIDKMPKVTVPNPDGENILVLFKPSSYLDGKTSRLFGYRADQLKGISSEDIPKYSFDGREVEEIKNIPNVECDASGSSVGRICVADTRLVQQLRVLSADKLQKDNMKIVITQAYRTYEIQKKLYDINCGSGTCTTETCNPDISSGCPHMQAGAIDVVMYDSSGKNLNGNGGSDPLLVEEIMCKYGFVRLSSENWHFEYGTNQWDSAVLRRENGEKVCTY